MTIPVAAATQDRDTALAQRDSFDKRRTELTAAIAALSQQATAGVSEGLEELPALAREKAEIDQKFAAAQQKLEQSAAQLQQTTHEARRERFEQAIQEGHEARTEFETLFGKACVALGTYCSRVEGSTRLANSLATQLGMWPEHRHAVAELTRPIEALRMVPEGYDVSRGYGWNLNVSVVPVQTRQKNGGI